MSSLVEIVSIGEQIGLEGQELQQFIKDREDQAREERRWQREAVQEHREYELKKLELENDNARLKRDQGSNGSVKETCCKPAFPKLPVFNESRSLETYQQLSPAQAKDYECVKEALLRSFQCTAEGYRVKFRTASFLKIEVASQFGNRLKNYFQRWMELAECEESYDDIIDLMLMEQFVNRCDKSMVLLLKEHAVKTFDQMLKLADM